jgi:NADH-quinone oxidoreductase subunit M
LVVRGSLLVVEKGGYELMSALLVWTILSPLIGAIIVLLATPKGNPKAARVMALVASLVPLGLFVVLARNFDYAKTSTWQFATEQDWIPDIGVRFYIGMDSISLWLVALTAFLTPIAILASFKYIKQRQAEFYAWMLILHAAMLGVFVARDVLLFYVFFEFTLIPMYFIIGIWGGTERRNAAGKFFLFTFTGSVLTLSSLIYLAYLNFTFHRISDPNATMSFLIEDLYRFAMTPGNGMSMTTQIILFLGMIAGFAVKVPLFPVHTWLPLAHTEAPTAGSVILAGVLLKLGTYGLLRLAVPMLPAAALVCAPYIGAICIVGIIYGALVSWVQQDMKKLIAYSSVSHLAFCVLGLFALTPQGITGSVMYMINHGLSTGALFLVVGMIYERYHTRDMNQIGGLARRVPALAFFAVFFVFSSVALPGLNGFVSEFLCLLGTFVSGDTSKMVEVKGHLIVYGNLGPKYALFATTGVILGAVYMLYWAGKIIFGPLKEPVHEHDGPGGGHHEEAHAQPEVKDLSFREWAVLTPIAVAVLILGVAPNGLMKTLESPVVDVANRAAMSVELPASADAVKTDKPTVHAEHE